MAFGHQESRTVADLRVEAGRRSAALGPIVAIAGLIRDYLRLVAELHALLAELPHQLEISDARLRRAFGQRWWDELDRAPSTGEPDERS